MITAERVREVLGYDPDTGRFASAGTVWRRKDRQTRAYLKIRVDGKQYLAHRLAWLFVHGRWPMPEIDHINGDGLDNRLCNLREATRAQNSTNALAQKSNQIGLRGVHFHPGAKRYRAQICKKNKTKHLGYFDTPEEAHAAYIAAAKILHGEFIRL